MEALLGQCRCLAALAEWDKLFLVCQQQWTRVEPHVRREMAPIAAHAAWQLGDWQHMKQYVDVVNHGHSGTGSSEGSFLSAVLHVKNGDYHAAQRSVERARELLGTELAALVGESYERAYGDMVRVQQLTELEEILTVKQTELTPVNGELGRSAHVKRLTQEMWNGRLKGVQRNVEVWQALLRWRRACLVPGCQRSCFCRYCPD